MKISSTVIRASATLAACLIFLGFASMADHLVLPRFIGGTSPEGLLFPPGSEFPYQTPEFTHKAVINSLGFRDREWNPDQKNSTTLILAIGDSFTFGMGVELDQTWSKILETRLRALGLDIEIANLGRPGASPIEYAEAVEKAVPLLKPDIILVAVLQGDDLAQTIRQIRLTPPSPKKSLFSNVWRGFTRTAQFLFPHSSRLIREHLADRSSFRTRDRLLENIWKNQAQKLAAGYRGEKKRRFDSMEATARDMFLKGHLNPGLVSMAIADPAYFATPLQTNDPVVQKALRKMEDHLQAIKKTAGEAEVMVASVPLGMYVSENAWQGAKEIGFTALPEMLHTSAPDEELERICRETAIPFFSVTSRFRRQEINEPLFYKYDGHLTARGHLLFVEELLPQLAKHVVVKRESGERDK